LLLLIDSIRFEVQWMPPNAGAKPRRSAPSEGGRFAKLLRAQTIITDLCLLWQKGIQAIAKADD
jgi:hypothetical protein